LRDAAAIFSRWRRNSTRLFRIGRRALRLNGACAVPHWPNNALLGSLNAVADAPDITSAVAASMLSALLMALHLYCFCGEGFYDIFVLLGHEKGPQKRAFLNGAATQ
jgi:hypothetical protein